MAFDFSTLCDEIFTLQSKVDKINAKAKADTKGLEAEIAIKEQELFQAMEANGNLLGVKGKKSKAEIKETLRISFGDFDKMSTFILREKALYLFERRISVKAYEELKAKKGNKPLPGFTEFTQRKLNVSKA